MVRTADGRRERVYGVPSTFGLPNTKVGAEEAERRAVNQALGIEKVPRQRGEVPTLEEFGKTFLSMSALDNKPSSLESKKQILRSHLGPVFGKVRLDEVTYAGIQDFKATKISEGMSKKSINNLLTVLHRLLVVARKRGMIETVPEFEWFKVERPDFDFLKFEESDRLLAATASEPEWRCMILVALRTGMRQGELLGLRWEDVDLVAGRIMVRQNRVRGLVGSPKSGKPREIPLGDEVLATLKEHRHLRGELVFCDLGGRPLTKGESKWPLWRACKKAGLRRIGWHVLRHTFASHLAMRGAPLKAIQELLGHSTIAMTMRYAHLAPEVARDAVRMLDGVAGKWQETSKTRLSS